MHIVVFGKTLFPQVLSYRLDKRLCEKQCKRGKHKKHHNTNSPEYGYLVTTSEIRLNC